ncbi:MAG: trimethylamine methyltransferase family protein [Armatimonadota bacterium]
MVRVDPPRLLTLDQLSRIREAAIRVLREHGLRVLSPAALQAAAEAGLAVADGRLLFDRPMIETALPQPTAPPQPQQTRILPPAQLELTTCQYATYLHDLETDTVVPFTEARVVEAAKLVDVLSEEGVVGGAPGCPCDVPPLLQPVVQYKIQAECCRHGRVPVDAKWVRTMPYVMEMAEVLGHPIRHLPVYMISPLTLGGESLDAAMAFRDRLDAVHVANMSSVGASAPVLLFDALALGLAEVIGGTLAVQALTGLPASWSVAAVPFDLRGGAMSYGGPEHLLFRWACHEVKAAFRGLEPWSNYGVIRTQAKLPGAQAAADKMAGLVSGALLGSCSFDGVGALSLEEVFSAEQAIVDCELRDYVQRLIGGIDGERGVAAATAEIAEGIYDGYLTLDSTLSRYRETYWLPKLWERRPLSGWIGAGAPDPRKRAKALAREKVKQHCYELPAELRRPLERIHQRAQQDLAT